MRFIPLFFLIMTLFGTSLHAQGALAETEGFPFLDYWPVLLLPIFGILIYGFWKRSKKRNS